MVHTVKVCATASEAREATAVRNTSFILGVLCVLEGLK